MTFTAQLPDWLESLGSLAARSAAAYSGEVNRMREFMADLAIHGVQEMTESHWLSYLQSLVEDRSAVASRRRPKLKVSSALQAGRITRLFLRHSYARGWIRWVPLGPRECRVEKAPVQVTVPAGLVELLFGPSPTLEVEARALSAIALAFWGSLNPRELAAAREEDLRSRSESGQLDVTGRKSPVVLPLVALRHVNAYHEMRKEQLNLRNGRTRADPNTPLLSQLGGLTALTPHRVWTLLKSWPPEAPDGQAQLMLGARTLRDTFLVLASHDAAAGLAAVRRQTGRLNLAALRRGESERRPVELAIERVMRNLNMLRQ